MSVAEVALRPYAEPAIYNHSGENVAHYESALETLDRLSCGVPTGDITDIVGVLSGIKPAAMVEHRPQLIEVAEKFDLSVKFFKYESEPVGGMTISRDPYLAAELAELFQNGWEADDRCRRIGTLLGYPRSATDYYIRRRHTIGKEDELPMILPESIMGTVRKEFCQFNLSPEHWREEIDGYAMPLEKAVRDLTPETFRKMEERVEMRKMTGSALGTMGVRVVSVSEDVRHQVGERAA